MTNRTPRKRTAWSRLFDAWWLDVAIVTVALAAVLLIPVLQTYIDLLGRLDLERRLGVYANFITVASLLAGFSTLAFSAYLGWTSRGITRVKDRVGPMLMVVWIAAIATPWFSTLVILVASIYDDGGAWSPVPARWFALAAMVLVILTLVRTVAIFVALSDVNDNPGTPTMQPTSKPLRVKKQDHSLDA